MTGRAGVAPRWGALIDVGPIVWVVLGLWVKLVAFNHTLERMWWLPEPSLTAQNASLSVVSMGALGTLLLLLSPVPLLGRRLRAVILAFVYVGLSVLIQVDTTLLEARGTLVSFFDPAMRGIVRNPAMMAAVVASARVWLEPTVLVTHLDTLAFVAGLPAYLWFVRGRPALPWRPRRRLGLALVVGGAGLVTPVARVVWHDWRSDFAYASLQHAVCTRIGLLPYHVLDALVHVPRSVRATPDDVERAVRLVAERERERAASPSPLSSAARGANLIVVMVESLSAFPIGLTVDGREIAPRLSAFARQSLHFRNFYDQTFVGTSADGDFSSQQSLHPLPLGVVASRYATNRYRGLPAILADQGYDTYSASAAPPSFWHVGLLHRSLGFARSDFEDTFTVTSRIGPWLADQEFLRQVAPRLRRLREPFMAYLVTASTHHPYKISPALSRLRLGQLAGTMLGDYLNAVHYLDDALGRFLDALGERGLLDRSVIAVYGDHKPYGRFPELDSVLGPRSWPARVRERSRLPLIVRLPKGAHARVFTGTGGHLDVTPTLLGLLGVATTNEVLLGRDLTTDRNSPVVFRDGSFTEGDLYFANTFGPIEASVCYDVASGSRVDCRPYATARERGREQLQVSDVIIRNDLIPVVRARLAGSAAHVEASP